MNFLRIFDRNRRDYEPIESSQTAVFSRVALFICTYVMLREFRPLDSFFTSFLTSPPLNLSIKQINAEIYPIATFSMFVFTIIVFLLTDYLRYKPIIIVDGIAGFFMYTLLLGKPTLLAIYVSRILNGLFYASSVASSTYLYAKVDDTTRYQKITASVRAFGLFGRFFRGFFSQLTLSLGWLQERSLLYFSVGGMALATTWALFIPSVERSIYFHREVKVKIAEDNAIDEVLIVKPQKLYAVIRIIVRDFKTSYSNGYVLKWSLWWSFAYGIFNQVSTYSQVLWQAVAVENGNVSLMNGAVDSIFTLSGALASYSIGFMKFDWSTNADLILSLVSLISAASIQFMYWSSSLSLIYLMHIIFGCLFQTTLTIAQSEVAQHIEKDSYGLIFGFNLFVGLGASCIFTYLFVNGAIITFSIREQFLFYAICFGTIAFLFLARYVWVKAVEDLKIRRPSMNL